MIILLNMHNLYNAQEQKTNPETPTPATQETPPQTEVTPQTTKSPEEKNPLQQWTEHIELLTKEAGKEWNAQDNIPDSSWKATAFDLAEKVVKSDASLVSALKTQFFDAIKAKIAQEKGDLKESTTNLIAEFNKMIEATATPMPAEKPAPTEPAKETPPATTPPAPEVVAPEQPATEPTPSPETPAPTTEPEAASTTPPTIDASVTEALQKDANTKWKELLDIMKKGSVKDALDALQQAPDIIRELLLNGQKQEILEKKIIKTLTKRGIAENVIRNEINILKGKIGVSPSSMPQTQQVQDTQAELRIKEEREKQKGKELQVQAALDLALKREQEMGRKQESDIQKLQVKMDQQIKAAEARAQAKLETARQQFQTQFNENMKKIAVAKKAESNKGIIASITDWWSGAPKTEDQIRELRKQQKQLFNDIAQAQTDPEAQFFVKKALKNLTNILLASNEPHYWDQEKQKPNQLWMQKIQQTLDVLIIQYHVMPLDDMLGIIKTMLESSGKISPDKINNIITTLKIYIKKQEQDILQKKQQIEAMKLQVAQRKQEIKDQIVREEQQRKEQILLAQQKIKDEEMRIEAEKARIAMERHKQIAHAHNYKNEKKEWYNLLDKVTQNKQASSAENYAYIQEALKKSHSLLQLAGNIPEKNKARVSQKLKQKFSVALLNQQKDGDQGTNVYHHMDIFNKEINKMLD